MKTGIVSLIIRKLVTTIVATTIFSVLLSFFGIKGISEIVYNQGNQFIGWFFIYLMYIGVIILIYGNLVSIVIEYLQSKWFQRHDWLYVLILGVFGLANGIFFQERTLAFYGMLAAILYAIIDKWLYKRNTKSKSVIMFFLIPIASLLISWGYFQFTSPPMPPFTKEDAVNFATTGEGTTIEHFPKDIGKWEGIIDGYQVKRETNAKEIEEEIYIVTFTENWKKGNEKGSWTLSYKIDRGSLTANGEQGNMPPYYEGN
ncbi:hypothetical protein J7E79_29915 [Bacillus sp. ISL-40]|uniref:hypothetical protein n=1 Tax=unclassified Bacillus (in: firmicutes) TaxID=185979 RepID=UPI001BE974BB|nr:MULTISPECIES: hypothetical protein [unclassified Bacillus (in: firmicutes)]MBT2701471.1 hypothetical protein [Bacillus sp. ISL-40]MBT2744651.1 hypothetical protein [Bacillus sp. ISL-77]